MQLTDADKAARILAVDEMRNLADQIRVMRKKNPLTYPVQVRIQKLEAKRKTLRETYMKLVWTNPSLSTGNEVPHIEDGSI